jgi:arylsulfatase A-like enzyme
VRADRLGLYGFQRQTTPNLERWARDARVFENSLAVAGTTVPNHASMFTGLLPSEHGASQTRQWLDDRHQTLAELLHASGYQTYLWAANPNVASPLNLQQGFETEEHPWDPATRRRALEIVREKVAGDRSNRLRRRLARGQANAWAIKAAGELAQEGLEAWLDSREPGKPWFAFLNYMEAHRPYIPPRRYREQTMTPRQVERSYEIDHSWPRIWAYTFGLHEFDAEELAVIAATYEATLLELDALFGRLLDSLRARGALENTVVILTADHGEHLGEQHRLDHQYTLYEAVLRVPLVIHYPSRFAPGRDPRPVLNFDLFPTLLDLSGVAPPPGLASRAVSLLEPRTSRLRLAEYPGVFQKAIHDVRRAHPDWDPQPWQRQLRALTDGRYKLIWGEDGRHELYDLGSDPGERVDLAARESELALEMLSRLETFLASLTPDAGGPRPGPEISTEHRQRLEALGYAAGPPEDPEPEP